MPPSGSGITSKSIPYRSVYVANWQVQMGIRYGDQFVDWYSPVYNNFVRLIATPANPLIIYQGSGQYTVQWTQPTAPSTTHPASILFVQLEIEQELADTTIVNYTPLPMSRDGSFLPPNIDAVFCRAKVRYIDQYGNPGAWSGVTTQDDS